MSKEEQYDYAILNAAIYDPEPQVILDKYPRGSKFEILEEDINDMVVKNKNTGKVILVLKGTDLSNKKNQLVPDMAQNVGIFLNRKNMVSRLRKMETKANRLERRYGEGNVIITGHSLAGYQAAEISNDTGIPAVAFNIGSSPFYKKKINFNKNVKHYTTNIGKNIDPISMTAARTDFYDRKQVQPKKEVGSGILKYHTISHFLPDLTDRDNEITEKRNNIGIDKMSDKITEDDIKGMNITALKREAKSLGVKRAYKWKAKDIKEARSIMLNALREKKGESEIEEQEEEKKEEAPPLPSKMPEEEKAPPLPKKLPLEAEDRVDRVDTTISRNMGETPAQRVLDRIADDRTDKERAMAVVKKGISETKDLVSSKDLGELERKLQAKGLPMDKIKEYKNLYDKAAKVINKKSLEDGTWIVKATTAFSGPELAAYNEMVKAVGLGLDKSDKDKLRDLIDGNYKGSTADALKVIGKGLINPEGWGSMMTHTAKKRGGKVLNDFKDIFTDDDIYEERKVNERDAIASIRDRQSKEKEEIRKAKELARLKGEDYKGPEYRESKEFEKALGGPKLSEYGGQDDYSGWEKVGRFFVDAGIATAEEMIDPLGFIDMASGKESSKLQKLEQRLKEKNPGMYRAYKRALDKHIATIQKASVESKNEEMIADHKPVAKQLGNIISATLEENAKRLRAGEEPLLSKDKVEQYSNYADSLKSGKVSYHNLAQIDYMFAEDIPNLPENLNDKYFQWQMEEESMLGKQGAGDSELSISTDKEAQEQVASIRRARQADKEEQERAIRESKEAYEMVRQQEIDHDNEQTLRKRKEVIHPGFVETATNKPELRPRIIWGNTDAQFSQSPEEVRREKETLNRMLMWKARNRTEDNDPSNILYRRWLENQEQRYGKTFAMPDIPRKDRRIPQEFLRFNERIWVYERTNS
jgi:predicted esterase YcpF (UPF0227 family)